MRNKKAAFLAAVTVFSLGISGCGVSETAPQTVTAANTVPPDASGISETGTLAKYVMNCREIARFALDESGEDHPPYMEVTDETFLTDILGYDMSIAEDSCVNVQLVSTDLFELTIIRADEDNADAVGNMLEEHKEYLRKQAAYYPAQVKAADATRVGKSGRYHSLICCEEPGGLEKQVLSYILRG